MLSFGIILNILSLIGNNNASPNSENSNEMAIIISGGQSYSTNDLDAGTSVNLLSEEGYYLCSLPRLAGIRRYHTQTGLVACGGGDPDADPGIEYQTRTCDTFSHGKWRESHKLMFQRYKHAAWASPLGVILMGGYYSPFTTELLNDDGTSQPMFDLKRHYVEFCAIELEDKVILTGGYESKHIVGVYNVDGWIEDLPQLQNQHYKHGCGHYVNNDNQIVYMVTGGVAWPSYTPSTEIFVEGGDAWSLVGELPFGFSLMQVISLKNTVLLAGGYKSAEDFDLLLEFNTETTSWDQTGLLQIPRFAHGASAVKLNQLMDYCE